MLVFFCNDVVAGVAAAIFAVGVFVALFVLGGWCGGVGMNHLSFHQAPSTKIDCFSFLKSAWEMG